MTIDAALILLGLFAFCGGLIDAAVGGGGLIQLPALMHALPGTSLATVFGTNKLAVWMGSVAALPRYLKRVTLVWWLLLPMFVAAFLFAYLGALSVALIPKALMQYAVFVLLVVMAIYTFIKKDLGRLHAHPRYGIGRLWAGISFGAAIGFYDGVFGPGSGSLLLFVFVRVFGFDFLNASASAKLINLGTFSAALLFFAPSGHVLWLIGGLVGLCNMAGAVVGAFIALRHGSGVIRVLFLVLLVALIVRMGISLFWV